MRELRTEIEINATSDVVWNVLTDLSRYTEWNPFITNASGQVREGEQLSVHLEPPGGKPMTFKPTVTKVTAGQEFRWLGHLFFPGLFDGEHIFELKRLADNRVRCIQREEFRGVLVPFLWKSFNTNTHAGFEAMNRAMKERAEGIMSASGGA